MSSKLRNLIKAFGHALNGWKRGLKERNLKIHLVAAIFVLSASLLLKISTIEFIIILILIALVISAELFNTAIEEVCDTITASLKLQYVDTTFPRDLAAGAVLIVASIAALVGLLIFIPKLLTLF
ncbi:MAG TPA: diacylglycerol kinase family protein [Candidatus Woesebacteria bacterium]|nr:diacylglycerol kinase family protein [Candidatus Woesebacteria bacterium]HOY61129.1 diacylglycerol kinase family protein [Candidatus Woesebacteria bacterium]HPR99551.1 diacylglycerol kinase family protein [Candidatus Woesebacteria bacterium]